MLKIDRLMQELRVAKSATYPPISLTYVHWSKAEIKEMEWLIYEGRSYPEIARRLHRTVCAIRHKRYKLKRNKHV